VILNVRIYFPTVNLVILNVIIYFLTVKFSDLESKKLFPHC